MYFEKNFKEIKKYIFFPNIKYEQWKNIEINNSVISNQPLDCCFVKDEKEYRLISENPEKEIEYYVKGIDFNKDNLILLFGIAHVPLLKYLAKNISEGSKVLIIEPNLSVLKYVLDNENIASVFKTGSFALCVGQKFDTAMNAEIEAYLSMGWENLVYNLHIIMLANYYHYKEVSYDVVKYIRERLGTMITVMGNCLEDILNGFTNAYKNIDVFSTGNSNWEIRGKYTGYPGIVVASGPSLEKNIHHLKKANGKALIIACDASVDACKANGVELDAVASIERDEPTYTYYYKGKKFDDDLVLVGPIMLWPKIYEEFPGKKIIMSKMDEGWESWLTGYFDAIEFQNMGMSSANVAFKVAQLAGCNPIILVGQDLAYTDDKKHSDATHTEYEGENNSEEFDGTMVEDIHGNMIKSDFVYELFKRWFEARILESSELEVIDATEGGAKIKGSKIATLEETIEKYCVKQVPGKLCDVLEDKQVTEQEIRDKREEIIKGVTEEIEKLNKVKSMAENHYALLEKLYKRKIEKQSEKQLIKTVQEMQKGNDIVEYILTQTTISNFYKQIIKQTITHVKMLGNELTPENVIANLKLQGNLMGMIMRSSVVIIDNYEEMKKYLEEKQK